MAVFDLRADTRLSAGLNIAKTIFVCIVLTLAAIFFTKDANELVLIPIERMVEKVKRIAKDPLGIGDKDSEVIDIYELEEQDNKNSCLEKLKCAKNKTDEEDQFETTIIEQTIVKIGILLAIGFGEAGT
jgi:hypothetical protein